MILNNVLADIARTFAPCQQCGKSREGYDGPYCFPCENRFAEDMEARHAWEDENERPE